MTTTALWTRQRTTRW